MSGGKEDLRRPCGVWTAWGRNGGGTGRSFNSRFGAKTRHDACGGMTARRPSPRETRTRRGAAPSKDRRRPQATQTAVEGDRRKTGFRRGAEEGKNHTWFSSSPERAYRKGHALADRDALLHRHSASRADHVETRGCTSTPRTARATPMPTEGCDGKLAVKS